MDFMNFKFEITKPFGDHQMGTMGPSRCASLYLVDCEHLSHCNKEL